MWIADRRHTSRCLTHGNLGWGVEFKTYHHRGRHKCFPLHIPLRGSDLCSPLSVLFCQYVVNEPKSVDGWMPQPPRQCYWRVVLIDYLWFLTHLLAKSCHVNGGRQPPVCRWWRHRWRVHISRDTRTSETAVTTVGEYIPSGEVITIITIQHSRDIGGDVYISFNGVLAYVFLFLCLWWLSTPAHHASALSKAFIFIHLDEVWGWGKGHIGMILWLLPLSLLWRFTSEHISLSVIHASCWWSFVVIAMSLASIITFNAVAGDK